MTCLPAVWSFYANKLMRVMFYIMVISSTTMQFQGLMTLRDMGGREVGRGRKVRGEGRWSGEYGSADLLCGMALL